MSEETQKDKEDEGGRDPGPEFVSVNHLVAKSGHKEGAHCDDDDTGGTFDIVVDCLNKLSTDDRVDRRPANAGQNIEEGDC